MPYIIETWDKLDSKADPFNKAELFDRHHHSGTQGLCCGPQLSLRRFILRVEVCASNFVIGSRC